MAISATPRQSGSSVATFTGPSTSPLVRFFSQRSLLDQDRPVSPPIWNAIWNVTVEAPRPRRGKFRLVRLTQDA